MIDIARPVKSLTSNFAKILLKKNFIVDLLIIMIQYNLLLENPESFKQTMPAKIVGIPTYEAASFILCF